MKIAYTINEACEAIGIGRTMIYQEIALGRLPAVKLNKRTVIRAEDLLDYVRGLPAFKPTKHGEN